MVKLILDNQAIPTDIYILFLIKPSNKVKTFHFKNIRGGEQDLSLSDGEYIFDIRVMRDISSFKSLKLSRIIWNNKEEIPKDIETINLSVDDKYNVTVSGFTNNVKDDPALKQITRDFDKALENPRVTRESFGREDLSEFFKKNKLIYGVIVFVVFGILFYLLYKTKNLIFLVILIILLIVVIYNEIKGW